MKILVKFLRINELVGKIKIKRTKSNFKKLLDGKIKLPKKNIKIINEMFSHHLQSYNEDWSQIDMMVNRLMSKEFRKNFLIKIIVGNLHGTA